MRKRNIQIIIRLDKEENDGFRKRVKKSGLSQEAYIRCLINGLIPTDSPPPDYFAMMKELHYIVNRLSLGFNVVGVQLGDKLAQYQAGK